MGPLFTLLVSLGLYWTFLLVTPAPHERSARWVRAILASMAAVTLGVAAGLFYNLLEVSLG